MPPKPGAVPGYYPVEDEKDKGAKKSRRKRKGGSMEEPVEAGPSSKVTSPSPAQSGHGSGPSVPKQLISTGTTGGDKPTQTYSQPTPATPYSTQPAQILAQPGARQAGQSSSQPSPAMVSNKPLAGSKSARPGSSNQSQPPKVLPIVPGPTKAQSIKEATRTDSQAGPSEGMHQQHPSRPGGTTAVATQGRPIFLSTNYFRLTVKPGLKLYRYSIKVSPEAKGKKLAEIIKDALDLPGFKIIGPGLVSDFAANLLSPQVLTDNLLKVSVPYNKNIGVEGTHDRNLLKDTKDSTDAESPKSHYMILDFIRVVEITNQTSLQKISADQDDLPIVQDLDIVIGHHRKSSPDVSMIGKRRAFQTSKPQECDHKYLSMGNDRNTALLFAVRGFFSSVRLSTTGLLVNMNVTHGTFYPLTKLSVWLSMIEKRPQVNHTKIPGLLKGLRVGLLHLHPKSIIKTISGYASPEQGSGYEPHPPSVRGYKAGPQDVKFFEYKSSKPTMSQKDKENAKKGVLSAHIFPQCGCDGSYTSVSDYFKRKYPSFKFSDRQPVVNVGSAQHPSYLPLDVCHVLVQPAKVELSPNEMTDMQSFAVRVPHENADSIARFGFQTLGLMHDNPKLNALGISIDRNRVTLDGYTLKPPTVMFGNKIAAFTGSRWNLSGMPFKITKELESWACLNIHNGGSPSGRHEECLRNFLKVLQDCNITAARPHTTHIPVNDINRRLEREFAKMTGIHLLLVVLPNKNSQLYNQVKQLGDIYFGIQTICVTGLANKFYNTYTTSTDGPKAPLSNSYNASVALKVNIKNGGVNQVLEDDQLGFISQGTTMVIGIDVTHPSPGSSLSATSVAAMVASSDKYLAQWPAEIRVNPARQERVDMLTPMLRAHLIYWNETHGSFPEKLLIYRDGVSEGQYQMVLDEELPQLRAACDSLYEKQQRPRITLIIVGKRHHTRFYRTIKPTREINKTNFGKNGNPPFGTVMDTVIVDQARNWDFYLQSHTALDGTARPAHYFVLLDEIFRNYKHSELPQDCKNASDYLYKITYNMCYLFCRATTTVSIPPPVYYADLACERGRRWNSKFFDSSQDEVSGKDRLRNDQVRVHRRLEKTMFYI